MATTRIIYLDINLLKNDQRFLGHTMTAIEFCASPSVQKHAAMAAPAILVVT